MPPRVQRRTKQQLDERTARFERQLSAVALIESLCFLRCRPELITCCCILQEWLKRVHEGVPAESKEAGCVPVGRLHLPRSTRQSRRCRARLLPSGSQTRD